MRNDIVEITDDQLEEISGGMEKCKPGQTPTTFHERSTDTWWVGCDG